MLVYLHSADHEDTPDFCRQVLGNNAFQEYLQANADEFLLWGGDVRSLEAFKAAEVLRVARFPFVALIGYKQNRMQLVMRIDGRHFHIELLSLSRFEFMES
jgi:FAS-associated factor 2